jgi:hypothetical protein
MAATDPSPRVEDLQMKILIGVGALLALFASAAPASAQAMQPGLWETTARMEMPGMAMPPMTSQRCIRDASPERLVPPMPNCAVTSRGASGNTVRWSVRCQESGMTMTGDGEMTMRGTTYDGVLQMVLDQGGERQQMTHRYSGRRLGDC